MLFHGFSSDKNIAGIDSSMPNEPPTQTENKNFFHFDQFNQPTCESLLRIVCLTIETRCGRRRRRRRLQITAVQLETVWWAKKLRQILFILPCAFCLMDVIGTQFQHYYLSPPRSSKPFFYAGFFYSSSWAGSTVRCGRTIAFSRPTKKNEDDPQKMISTAYHNTWVPIRPIFS